MNELLVVSAPSSEITLIVPEFLQENYSKVVSVTDVYTQTLYGNVKVHASNVYEGSNNDTRFESYTVFNEYDNELPTASAVGFPRMSLMTCIRGLISPGSQGTRF